MKQPEALRLAELLEHIDGDEWKVFDLSAAELRRLHEANQAMLEALTAVSVIKDQLYGSDWEEIGLARRIARAAIAKATGE